MFQGMIYALLFSLSEFGTDYPLSNCTDEKIRLDSATRYCIFFNCKQKKLHEKSNLCTIDKQLQLTLKIAL